MSADAAQDLHHSIHKVHSSLSEVVSRDFKDFWLLGWIRPQAGRYTLHRTF